MPYGGHADRHEIVRSQVRQNLPINVVLAESLLVLSETQAPQPARNVHVFGLRKRQDSYRLNAKGMPQSDIDGVLTASKYQAEHVFTA